MVLFKYLIQYTVLLPGVTKVTSTVCTSYSNKSKIMRIHIFLHQHLLSTVISDMKLTMVKRFSINNIYASEVLTLT